MTWNNCAVCLYFDAATEELLRPVYEAVAAAVPDGFLPWRPHITLSSCDGLDGEGYRAVLKVFAAQTQPFSLMFSSVGVFPGTHGTVFLSPTVTPALLKLNRAQENALSGYAAFLSPHYQVGRWVPHCTLASRLSAEQVSKAIAAVSDTAFPLAAIVQAVGVVQIASDQVQSMYTYLLAAEAV